MLRLLTFGGLAVEAGNDQVAPKIRPPRLALLAVLAAAGTRGCTRERLIGLFWPEADEERGRHSLRQQLYALRNEAGDELVRAGPILALNGALIGSDLADFLLATETGRREQALALYRGPFLDGFYLPGAVEFERWVEAERSRLAEARATALLALATEATSTGSLDAALRWWHQLVLLDPLSGRYAVGYARALAASGDRAGALAHVRSHESAVWRELEVEPDPDVRRFEAELKDLPRAAAPSVPQTPEVGSGRAEPAQAQAAPAPAPAVQPSRARSARRMAFAGLTTALLIAVILGARQLRSDAPEGSGLDPAFSNVTTSSPLARRFFQEGVRAFYAGDRTATARFMDAALAEDSTFAMAAWFASQVANDEHAARQRALRLASAAPDPERLIITADLLVAQFDPAGTAAAEALAEAYPSASLAQSILARARQAIGDWPGAVAAYERAIALGLEAERSNPGLCLTCSEYGRLAEVYQWWDSLPAVERTARRLLDAHPGNSWGWALLAIAAARVGDSAMALNHLRRGVAATPTGIDQNLEFALRLSLEQYEQVTRDVEPLLASPRREQADIGRWVLLMALRNQGRLADARQLLRTGQIGTSPPPAVALETDYVWEALLALESGQPDRAASFFDARRRSEHRPTAPGHLARWVAWNTTLTATALAAVGDTAAVRRLADTVQVWGEQSLFGRDRLLHHFLRGLVLAAEGDDRAAVEAYRRAVFSPTLGYTRVNYELARSLLRLGRPREAVAVLQPALRGDGVAANLYLTRTEVHQLLAIAFRAAGMADSAAVHQQAVDRAWGSADPDFLARRSNPLAR